MWVRVQTVDSLFLILITNYLNLCRSVPLTLLSWKCCLLEDTFRRRLGLFQALPNSTLRGFRGCQAPLNDTPRRSALQGSFNDTLRGVRVKILRAFKVSQIRAKKYWSLGVAPIFSFQPTLPRGLASSTNPSEELVARRWPAPGRRGVGGR